MKFDLSTMDVCWAFGNLAEKYSDLELILQNAEEITTPEALDEAEAAIREFETELGWFPSYFEDLKRFFEAAAKPIREAAGEGVPA